MRLRGAALGSLLAILAAASSVAGQPTAAERALATALFRDGRALMREERWAEACAKLAESQRLDPSSGTLLNLGLCHEKEGKTATAWAELNESLALALRENRRDREDVAREHLAALEPVLPRLTIELTAEAAGIAGLEIALDSIAIRAAVLGTAVPVDPGEHVVSARAPERTGWSEPVRMSPGQRLVVRVPALASIEPPPVAPAPVPAPAPVAAPPPVAVDPPPPLPRKDTARADDRVSHAGQLGALARVDVDGAFRGASAMVGLSYGIGAYVEPVAGAMLGPSSGAYAGVSVFPLHGSIKPVLLVGVPVFFVEGPRPGLHTAAGVLWDSSRHAGLFVQLGGMFHPLAPDGYDTIELIPSLGAQARL